MTETPGSRSRILQFFRRTLRNFRMRRLASSRRHEKTGFDPEGVHPFPRKLRVEAPQVWPHHRAGWGFAVQLLEEKLHHSGGTLFLASLSDPADLDLRVREPWVGVVHQPLHHEARWPDFQRILASEFWRESRASCRGLFTLSRHLRDELRDLELGVPVDAVPYPGPEPARSFEPSSLRASPGRLLHVGGWLRDPQTFLDVAARGWEKRLLHPPEMDISSLHGRERAELCSRRISDEEYDRLLATSVVFLRFDEVAGSTTVIECLARATPLVVNDRPALREYLGKGYPLVYRDLEEAAALLADRARLEEGHRYLRDAPERRRISARSFLETLTETETYRALPTP